MHGISLRVPTPTVSLVDLVVTFERDVTEQEINDAVKAAAEGPLKGILQYCVDPVVSSDFKGSPYSSIFDSLSTMVLGGNTAKVLAWYDNEWGYSSRVADLIDLMVKKGL
jgi:glyceraldehyde 3-phosphate dehydrogenase